MFSLNYKSLFILLFATIALGLIYFFPQLHHWKNGYEGANIIHIDEFSYLARLERATQHKESLCNMWVIEKEGEPCLVPVLPERILAAPSYLFKLNSEQLIIIYRPLLAILGFLIFFFALRLQDLKFFPALFVSISFYLLPAAWYFKPGFSLISSIDLFAFNRFTNPLFSLCLFFLSWCYAYLAFAKNNKKSALYAGIFLGLNFYVSIFYWTHLALTYLIAFFVFGFKMTKVFTRIVVSSAIVSIPYWLHSFSNMKHPAYETIAWRLGLFVNDPGIFLLKNYFIYPYLLISLLLMFSQRTPEKWAGLSFVSGLICYLSPAVTQIEFQNFHYKYTLVPFAMLVLFYGLKNIYSKAEDYIHLLEKIRPRLGFPLLLFLITLATFKIEKFSQREARFVSNSKIKAYQKVFQFLRQEVKPPKVIVAHEEIMTMIPFKTGHYGFQDSGVEFSTNSELYARNSLYWMLKFGNDFNSLSENLTPKIVSVPVWIYGFPKEIEEDFKKRNFPTLAMEEQKQLAQAIAKHWSSLNQSELLKTKENYKMDYVILGPKEIHLKKNIRKFLKLELVKDFQSVQLFRIL